MLIGSRLATMARAGGTRLDWLQGLGAMIVETDFSYESVTWPVEVEYEMLDNDVYDGHGCWPAIASAGCQLDDNAMMMVSTAASNSNVGYFSMWYLNGIYLTNPGSDIVMEGRGFRKVRAYKGSDDPSRHSDVVFEAIDSAPPQVARPNNPGWTTSRALGPFPLAFFGTVDPATGETLQHTTHARLKACRILPSVGDDAALASFFPALGPGGVPGMYDEVARRFHPARGACRYSIGGEIVEVAE